MNIQISLVAGAKLGAMTPKGVRVGDGAVFYFPVEGQLGQ